MVSKCNDPLYDNDVNRSRATLTQLKKGILLKYHSEKMTDAPNANEVIRIVENSMKY